MHTDNFIPRKFQHESKSFDEFIHDYNISIILGETGSGKTYLLKNYYERHQESSKYIELVALDYEEVIDKHIEVIFLDSIDEALYHNPSDKILKKKLSHYILKCREINEKVKFVIACRYSEWKSLYEDEFRRINPTQPQQLKEIIERELTLWKKQNSVKQYLAMAEYNQRKELENKYKDRSVKIYHFDVLSKKDLENILLERRVDREVFSKFIVVNQLGRIDNAQMIIKLIDNFERYQNKELKYYEIYHAIIENHLLAETDNERKILLQKLSLEEMINIVSCIAYHMVKNSTPYISIEETYEILVNEKLEGLKNANISIDKLKTILNTSLFKGFNFNIDKSMTNYLVAYFINKNGIDPVQTCVHELDIIERFKDAFVHLLHLDLELFSKILEINPFVFKQHYILDESQQKKLFENILVVFQEKKYLLEKHEQDYLSDNALTRFDKIDNLEEVLKEKIDIKKLDKELYHYILRVTEINCTEIQSDSMLLYFWKKIYEEKGKIECKEILIYQFDTNNFHHNKKLFSFLKEHELFENVQSKLSLEFKLLEFFLRQKSINNIDFLLLVKYVPIEFSKTIIVDIEQGYIENLFDTMKEKYDKNLYTFNYVILILYGLLNYEVSKITLEKISSFLQNYKFNSSDISKSFKRHSNNIPKPKGFCNYEQNILSIFELCFIKNSCILMSILEFNDKDIQKVLEIYPVEKYMEKYRQLIFIPKIRDNLFQNYSDLYLKEKEEYRLSLINKSNQMSYLYPTSSRYGEEDFSIKNTLKEEEINFDINTSLDEFIKEYEEQQTSIKFFIDDLKQKINPSGHIGINPLRDKREKYIESNINRDKLKKLIFLSYSNSNEEAFIRNNEFEISLLWQYFNKEDLEELSSSDNDRVVTEAKRRLLNVYNDENKEIETIYKEIIEKYKYSDKPLIITEGKTDWKHLKKALERFKDSGEYLDLDIEFLEYQKMGMGESQVSNRLEIQSFINRFVQEKNSKKYLHMFDRDTKYSKDYRDKDFVKPIDKEFKKFLKEKLSTSYRKKSSKYKNIEEKLDKGFYQEIDEEFKKILTVKEYEEWDRLANCNVYAFCIPKLSEELDEICIEFYYKQSEVKEAFCNGRRLFYGNELNQKPQESLCGQYKTDKTSPKALDILDGSDKKKVYHVDDIKCENNLALSKNEFAENIYHDVKGFDNFNIDNFKKIFDVIKKIVND